MARSVQARSLNLLRTRWVQYLLTLCVILFLNFTESGKTRIVNVILAVAFVLAVGVLAIRVRLSNRSPER